MPTIPGLDADVFFGDAEKPLPNWRDQAEADTADEPEDELSQDRLDGIKAVLGFDPDELSADADDQPSEKSRKSP